MARLQLPCFHLFSCTCLKHYSCYGASCFADACLTTAQVLAVVFSWNLALTGQASKITGKIKHDLVPTMVNGVFATFIFRFLGRVRAAILIRVQSARRVEVLGTCVVRQLLGGAPAAPGVVHVNMQCFVDGVPVLCIKRIAETTSLN